MKNRDATTLKVLMLGWEYPPHITGGLGTACLGLTTALAKRDVAIDFVVPHLFGDESAPHMRLSDAADPHIRVTTETDHQWSENWTVQSSGERVRQIRIPSFLMPYASAGHAESSLYLREHQAHAVDFFRLHRASKDRQKQLEFARQTLLQLLPELSAHADMSSESADHYGPDLFGEVARYAARVMAWASREDFDLIHAHDWMTYPAAMGLAQATGKPFVAHVHSLEVDRSGSWGNARITSLEHLGLVAADRVVAVSGYTKTKVTETYNIAAEKIDVVYNANLHHALPLSKSKTGPAVPTVLFLGRLSPQKGPDYFIEAAAKVAQRMPEARFVVAGSGGMLPELKQRVTELGVSSCVNFVGFLSGDALKAAFAEASVYVMPSVSEPFGIAALEAVGYRCPVIVSKQSGVSEVMRHALKVDFWDVDRLADLMIASLKYPELRNELTSMSARELEALTWDRAADSVLGTYRKTIASE